MKTISIMEVRHILKNFLGHTIGCGNPGAAYFYFISFQLIVSFIFLNLFIAIILEGFDDSSHFDNFDISEYSIEQFKDLWSKYDPKGTGYIKTKRFPFLLMKLAKEECTIIPDFDKIFDKKERNRFIARLQVPTYHNFQDYFFLDILQALSKIIYRNKYHEEIKQKKLLLEDAEKLDEPELFDDV
jgi:hypothetical protein